MSFINDPVFDHSFHDTLRIEKGYVDNKRDLGGKTRFGVTEGLAQQYRHLWPKYKFNGVMSELPLDLAKEIYFLEFWVPLRLGQIARFSPELSHRIFDFAVNTGKGNAVTALQRLLNVLNHRQEYYPDIRVDGGFGDMTFNTVVAYFKTKGQRPNVDKHLELGMLALQLSHYVNISESRPNEDNEVFTEGWFNRAVSEFKSYANRKL